MAEIPLESDAVAANSVFKSEGLLSVVTVAEELGRLLGVTYSKGRRGSVQEKHRWVVLYRLAESLPDEYKYGFVDAESGIVSNAALNRINLAPYLEQLRTNVPEDELDNIDELVEAARNRPVEELPGPDQMSVVVPPGQDAASAAMSEGFIPGVVSATAQPVEQTLREDIEKGFEAVGTQPFAFTGVIGGQQFLDDYRRRNEEWLNQLTTDQTIIDMPKLEALTPGQARAYIYGLSRVQVIALQRMLGRAGYFNQIGRAYSTLGTVDDNTKLAWDMMLLDSARTKTPVSSLLKERISTYANEANIEYSDPQSWISAAQEFGGKVLGRTLTGNEMNSFMRAVRTWERDAALGPTVTGEPKVDVEARAQAYFDEQFQQERAELAFEAFNQRYMRGQQVRGS